MDQNLSDAAPLRRARDRTSAAPSADWTSGRRPSVGVLVDLALTPTAGGHVRFWQNIAHAAAEQDCGFDLTFHFQSDPDGEAGETRIDLGEHVRIVQLPPVFSTARMKFLAQSPDHTDLAPYHRPLASALRAYDVIHTTDAYFAYARTATRVVDHSRQALVSSIHTDTPAYTRLYSGRAFENLFGGGRLTKLVNENWNWPAIAEDRMRRSLAQHLRACEHVWFSPVDDPATFSDFTNPQDFDVLRRGLDWQVFSPERADRARLESEWDFDPDDFVLAFAGRIDIGKEIMVAARATRLLLDRGRKVKLILAGLGDEVDEIRELLGDAVRLPGFVDQKRLGSILASSDAFVFPSRIETAANAVIEARAVGLPALTSPRIGSMLIREHGVDGLVVETQTPEAWADAIDRLMSDLDAAKKMGALATSAAAATQPSWSEVLTRDLAPGWRSVLRTPDPGEAGRR